MYCVMLYHAISYGIMLYRATSCRMISKRICVIKLCRITPNGSVLRNNTSHRTHWEKHSQSDLVIPFRRGVVLLTNSLTSCSTHSNRDCLSYFHPATPLLLPSPYITLHSVPYRISPHTILSINCNTNSPRSSVDHSQGHGHQSILGTYAHSFD